MVLETIQNISSMGFRQSNEKKTGRGIKGIPLLLNGVKVGFALNYKNRFGGILNRYVMHPVGKRKW